MMDKPIGCSPKLLLKSVKSKRYTHLLKSTYAMLEVDHIDFDFNL